MNNSFAERMLQLRQKKGISQKQAAESLGVSQALLSHYEKGIRECSLDFLVKAAAFYDVSSDYLLGISETDRPFKENFEDVDVSVDAEFRTSTLFRAASMLRADFVANGANKDTLIKQYFAMCIYNLTMLAVKAGYVPKTWMNMSTDSASAYSKAALETLSKSLISDSQQKPTKVIRQPMCIKTVIAEAEKLIVKNAKTIANVNLETKN